MRIRLLLSLLSWVTFAQGPYKFTPSDLRIETFDFVEVKLEMTPMAGNPFADATLTGMLHPPGEPSIRVTGFADSMDGSVFRIRLLARKPGRYTYDLRFQSKTANEPYHGAFIATESRRKGLVQVDAAYPTHFQWSGTGERYFWNGLTTYALLGWKDEDYIHKIIDRAAQYKVSRLRVTLNGPRVENAMRWYEPVKPGKEFRFLFGPWPAAKPDEVKDPGYDITRFDVEFWRKVDRTIAYAREKDVVISVIFFLDGQDPGADPFGKEKRYAPEAFRYYSYAAARLAAYTNVAWDVTNEWHLFRDAWWVERMGTHLKASDPYGHILSSHGRGEFPWRLSQWPDFAMYQIWDEAGGYEPMLKRRNAQIALGRPLPQINEEYGYEDHYPVKWGGNRRPPSRSADNRRRMAWQISMAGAYQTTGERANSGEGENGKPTPGGWINGGFEESMTMLAGYRHLVDFFLSIPYYELEPSQALGLDGALVLAKAGERYVVYFPNGGKGGVRLPQGAYRSRWFDPRTVAWTTGPALNEGEARLEAPMPNQDWVLLVER